MTDTSKIEIIDYSKEESITYENEYERQVLEKDENNNDYKIIKIDGDMYSGYLAIVYNPSRISVATSKYLGTSGQYLTNISEENNAILAINAGGFIDDSGEGTGGIPLGITVSNGKIISNQSYTMVGGLVGFDNNNKLILSKCSSNQAKSLNVRDAVSFGPFLIINGDSSLVQGNGGWGRAPRTAIAQRKDGIVLFLVLDGDRTLGRGATLKDEIEILERYGAYNASNLDGGTSTAMVAVKNQIINDPTTQSGNHRTRPVASAFILKSDDADNGDYSIVKEKIEN